MPQDRVEVVGVRLGRQWKTAPEVVEEEAVVQVAV